MKTLLRILIILLAAALVITALVALSNTEFGANILFKGETSGNQLRLGNGQGNGNRNRAGDGGGGQHQASGITWTTWLKNLGIIGILVLLVVVIDTVKSDMQKRRRERAKAQA
jgi:hypothetical protein